MDDFTDREFLAAVVRPEILGTQASCLVVPWPAVRRAVADLIRRRNRPCGSRKPRSALGWQRGGAFGRAKSPVGAAAEVDADEGLGGSRPFSIGRRDRDDDELTGAFRLDDPTHALGSGRDTHSG